MFDSTSLPRRALPMLAGLALAAAASGSANAVDTLDQSIWVRVGAFHPSINSSTRVDHPVTNTTGTNIDFEDIGLRKSKTLPTLLVGARFLGDWRAEFEYFELNRNGSTTLGQLLNFDDSTFPAQGELKTDFESTVYRASVGYSFLRTPQAEFGAVIGAHVTRLSLLLEGNATVDGVPVLARREEHRHTVPLPTIGVYGGYAVAPNWTVTARADVFSLKHSHWDGRLVNAQANVIYRVTSNIGVGVGYRYDDYRVISTKENFHGRVDYTFKGPQVFVEAGF